MSWVINLLSDGSECVPYQIPEFPIYAGKGWISHHRDMHALVHWHDDMELSVVLQGTLKYTVNDEIVEIPAGEGIFVNSRQLHSNFSDDGTDSEYICVLIHPAILCANALTAEQQVEPVMRNSAFSWQKLTPDVAWQAEIMRSVRTVYEQMTARGEGAMLGVQAHAFLIAEQLSAHMPEANERDPYVDRRRIALRSMVGFIQKHFTEKIALKDIAAAGNVSITTCHDIFRKHMKRTPLEYLTGYRLNKAAERLRGTELSITEIALSCGFSGSSYFAECFRREMGMSPGEYRRGE